jgi:hypothetical protein
VVKTRSEMNRIKKQRKEKMKNVMSKSEISGAVWQSQNLNGVPELRGYVMNLGRRFALLAALVLVLASGSGCVTQGLLAETKPHYKLNPQTEKMEEVPGNNGAYAGIPFAAAWDVATAPFVGLIFVLWVATGPGC